jgi:hypothetical protein
MLCSFGKAWQSRSATSVTQLRLRHYQHIITCQYGCYDPGITRQYGFSLITHHYISLFSITRQCMLLWKKIACCRELIMFILSANHIAPVCQSWSMHTPRFVLRTGLSHLRFFERRMSSQGVAINGGVHCSSKQVGQRLSNIVLSPVMRGSCWFLLTLMLSLQS